MSGISRRAFLGVLAAGAVARPRFASGTFRHDGLTLPYRIASPNTRGRARHPLVLWLHGGAGRGTDNEAQLGGGNVAGSHVWLSQACYVVAPQCPPGTSWTTIDTVDPLPPLIAAAALVAELQQSLRVDPARLYVTGQSMGGFGTWALLAYAPGRFAAGVPVCGGGNETRAAAVARSAVWVFHGAEDRVVPVTRSRTMVDAVRRAGGAVRYTEYPDVAHDSWTRAFAEPQLVLWVFAQRKRRRGR